MSKQDYAEAISRPSPMKKGSKELRSVEIEKADNGGHTVTHRFHSPEGPYHEPETHVFGKNEGKKLVEHLQNHLGIEMQGAEAEDKGEGEEE